MVNKSNMSIKAQGFRDAVLEYREKNGMTLEDVGRLIGYNNRSGFSQILNGRQEPSIRAIVELSKLTGKSVAEISGEDVSTTPHNDSDSFSKVVDALTDQLKVKDEQILYCLKQIDRLIAERTEKEKGR